MSDKIPPVTDLPARLRWLYMTRFERDCERVAADAIEAQQREIERLKVDVETYMQIANEAVAERKRFAKAWIDSRHKEHFKRRRAVMSDLREAAEAALDALLGITGQGRVSPSGASEALAAIAALRAALAEEQREITKLTAERDAARKDAASAQNAVSEWYDKVRAVEAERDAARDAALEEAAKMCEELRGFRPNECDHIAWLIRAMKENRDE